MDLDYLTMRRNLDDFCDHMSCGDCPLDDLYDCDFLCKDSVPDEVILTAYRKLEDLGMVDSMEEPNFEAPESLDFGALFM